jgi:glycyl-tRNA synthetase beta chain
MTSCGVGQPASRARQQDRQHEPDTPRRTVTEELPPKALAKLGDAFAAGIVNGLQSRGFSKPTPPPPLRLRAAWPCPSPACAPPRPTNPSAKRCRWPWRWTPKAARRTAGQEAGRPGLPCHRDHPGQLERAQDGKAESFFYTYTAKGSALAVGLQAALEESLSKLPIPKVMSYQRQFGRRRRDVQFVRPAHAWWRCWATTWCRSTCWA